MSGFDDKLDVALSVPFIVPSPGEGERDPMLDWWDSWFVYFINPADPDACEDALLDFGHKWSDESPQVMLYLLGDGYDLQVLYNLRPDGSIFKSVNDINGKYEHFDVGEYDEMVKEIEDAVLDAVPKAKSAVEGGLELLRQKPVSSKYELSDEDEWEGSKSSLRFAVNYNVLGFGDL
jgi:hypothetical protein